MQYIFIHGLGQDSSSWSKTISAIKKPIQPTCPDLFSLLENNEVTYANLYRAFSDYCQKFSEPLNLCGLSLGGVLALNYAIDNPTKIQSLVLIGTQYKMPRALLKLQNIIFRVMPNSVFKGMGLAKKDVINLTNSMMHIDFSAELKNISCRTLIICGVKDSANKRAANELSKTIQSAELKFISNASHEVNKDNPEILALEIESSCP